jgi:opacity protein-like surface antigen
MKLFTAIFAIVLALAFSTSAMAEVGSKGIGGALEIAFPMGDFGNQAGTGFGVTANFQYGWKPNIDLMAQLGYISWGGKSIGNYDYSIHAIPLQVGGKYYFTQETNRFYAGGLIGFHRFGITVKHTSVGDISTSDGKFGIAPMAGYEMKIGEGMLLDASARYQIVTDNLSYFGIRAGIIYKLK